MLDFETTIDEQTGEQVLGLPLSGLPLLDCPMFNKGCAFTEGGRSEFVGRVSRRIALAVAAEAQREGLAEPTAPGEMGRRIEAGWWEPSYRRIRMRRRR